jgi:hypothetical protein
MSGCNSIRYCEKGTKMADEIQTAETSAEVASESTTKPKSASVKRSAPVEQPRVKYNSRGVPINNWDIPENDPNLRKHAGEDPTGESNTLKPEE